MRMSSVWLAPSLFLVSFLISHFSVTVAFPDAPNNVSPLYLSHDSECDALLRFGNSFIINENASLCEYGSYPKTASWKNGTDCCSWDGVTCQRSTGYVTGLDLSCGQLQGDLHPDSSLFSLSNLQQLNLAYNDFKGSRVSTLFGFFTKMTHLNISESGFSGPIPSEMISRLSRLVSLDVSCGSGCSYVLSVEDDHSFKSLVRNLTRLRKLTLDRTDMSRVSPLSLANLSSSLTHLSLIHCNLRGIFPVEVFRMPNLNSLSLSRNLDLGGTLPETNWTGPIISLDLSHTTFHGPIPALLGNLTSLNYIDLSFAKFTGPFPVSLGNLDRLTYLDLSSNNLGGKVDFEMFGRLGNLQHISLGWNNFTLLLKNKGDCSFSGLEVLWLPRCGLTKVPYFLSTSSSMNSLDLDLSANMISGPIPEWFWRVWRDTLISLDLSFNNFTGQISSSICQVSSLEVLTLAENNIDGNIPSCLGNLSSLSDLDLGHNLLQGTLPESLANCMSLQFINASYNQFYGDFPGWINATQGMYHLDLQSNKFRGVIPEMSIPPLLIYFVISNNRFDGPFPMNFFQNSKVRFIELAGNNFEGPLPIPPPTVKFYFTANNKFTRDIPRQLCNAPRLDIIYMSNNSLVGTIPPCIVNLNLSVLDLQANKFVGNIPDICVPGGVNLRTIRLSKNRFGGTLPRSLGSCKNLEVLDLGENELEGAFPQWLGILPNLQVLALRSNKLHGTVNGLKFLSTPNRPLEKLRIFDLSDNYFSGPLPARYIANFMAMKDEEGNGFQYMGEQYYQDSIVVGMKGMEMELEKILTVFTTIDLSSNFFEGEIPADISQLKALKGLNFSHNNLTGAIPSFGNLTNLEWLDLSSNRMIGKIPPSLADLSFLSFLNLSNNQLVGTIPQGGQFDTFKSDSFEGNLGLCGNPLPRACGPDKQQPPTLSPRDDEDAEPGHWIEWRAALMGLGCGVVLGISLEYIVQETGRPWWLAKLIEKHWTRRTNNARRSATRLNRARHWRGQ